MDLGEMVTADLISEKHDEDCYFCTKDKIPGDMVNDLEDDYNEDADIDGVEFDNNSGKLARSLGGAPTNRGITVGAQKPDVSCAAHHCIPGNGSLASSDLFKSGKYLITNGAGENNIGYDINSRPNGHFLPGNYAVRPWSSKNPSFKTEYATKAIERWERQFHDSHYRYNKEVRDALNQLCLKIDQNKIWCPEAKDQEEVKGKMYALVARLHTISGRLRRHLVFPVSNWRKNVWTSGRSLTYMEGL